MQELENALTELSKHRGGAEALLAYALKAADEVTRQRASATDMMIRLGAEQGFRMELEKKHSELISWAAMLEKEIPKERLRELLWAFMKSSLEERKQKPVVRREVKLGEPWLKGSK